MLCNCCRQLKAQEVAKKGGQKQMGGADVQSKAPTTTQSKANDPKVPHPPAVLAVGILGSFLPAVMSRAALGCAWS